MRVKGVRVVDAVDGVHVLGLARGREGRVEVDLWVDGLKVLVAVVLGWCVFLGGGWLVGLGWDGMDGWALVSI